MRTHSFITGVALLAWIEAASAASPLADAASRLDGEWRGPEIVLKIDSKRAQASIDPDRPFEWKRFEVKEVTGEEVVFTIGAELFEAIIDVDTLVLSGTTFRGERVLFRDAPLRGTTQE